MLNIEVYIRLSETLYRLEKMNENKFDMDKLLFIKENILILFLMPYGCGQCK